MDNGINLKKIELKACRFVLVLQLLALLSLLLSSTIHAADCSNYIGKATINELFRQSQGQGTTEHFAEVKILDNAVTKSIYNNWYLIFCSVEAKDNGLDECSTQVSVAEVNDNNNEWLVMKNFNFHYIDLNADKPKKNKHGMEVTLWDENGKLIDYLSVDGYTKTGDKGCSFPHNTNYPGSNSFDLKRLNPDGTGDWTSSPGNSDKSTEDSSNDGSSGSCTLGSFSIEQDNYALACPQTRASVTIVPYCADGQTIKTDYAGTANLTSNQAGTLFYAASSGGNALSSISFDGSSGTATIYIYHNQEQAVQITAADAGIIGTGNATDFRAYGFQATMGPTSMSCGNSNPVTITAFGKEASNAGCGIITGFAGNKDLQVWLDPYYVDSGTTTAVNNNIALNSIILPVTEPGANNIANINFTNGQATLDVLWNDVGRVNLHIKHDDYPYDGVSGAAYNAEHRAALIDDTGIIILQPEEFEVLATLADGTPLNNIEPLTASPALKAGSGTFNATVTAKCANDITAENFIAPIQVTPDAPDFAVTGDLSDITDPLNPVQNPTQTTINGSATFNNLTYDEVGYFTLNATSANYLNSGNDISGSYITGRFTPDHYTLVSSLISTAADWGAPFVYMEQAKIQLEYHLEARNSQGDVTENYENTFATGVVSSVLEDNDDGQGHLLNSRLSSIAGNWNGGVMAQTLNNVLFFRDTSPDGPFANLNIGLQIDDAESSVAILLENQDMNHFTAGDCITAANCTAKSLGSTDVRYGRIAIDNAYGSELAALSMPVYTQYFNGTEFVSNTDDIYTSALDVTFLDLSNDDEVNQTDGNIVIKAGSTTATLGTAFIAGDAGLMFAAPGEGNTGYTNVLLRNIDSWLLYDWNGDMTDTVPPEARASFGIYNRSKRLIYTREVY